jgi:hypothetical protein
MRFGFCGGSYASESSLVDAQQSINFYPEMTENQNSRVSMALYRTPGLGPFATLVGPSVRGTYIANGRRFAVSGTHLYELSATGAVTDYGAHGGNNNILDDGLPAVMVSGGTDGGQYPGQLLIASGGTLTAFSLATNAFKAITGAPANVLMIEFIDGFFIALLAGNSWQVSNVEDCTNWSGLAVSQVSVFSNQLLSMVASNRLLWVFGGQRAVAYYDSGNSVFPFDVASGSFMEVGIQAQYSACRVATKSGTTVCWLGGDERGGGIVYAASGFIPARVSDHALEFFLQNNTVSDAVGFATQERGHNFYNLWFPTANATWVLDVDLGIWHQKSSLVAGQPGAHLARCHMYDGSQHLIGDRTSGNVYVSSIASYDEFVGGVHAPIVRTRIGPTVSTESKWGFINEFQVDFETGLGPIPPLTDANGNPRDPYAMFSYSTDFAKTFGNERMIACGQAGNYQLRAVDRRLGKYRNWTPKVTVSDAIPWSIADAYINPTQDAAPRYSKSVARVA